MSDKKPISAAEVPGFNRLTLKEQAFVQHPDVYRDPKKAALEIGYSSSTIEKRAHSMRQRLMRFIQPAFEAQLAKIGVDRTRVEEELACIAFTDVTEYQERIDIEMPDGGFQSVMVWKDPDSLPEHMRRAIKAVVYGSTVDADGNAHQSDRPTLVHFHSKEKALKELAGLFGDVAPRNPVDEQQELFDNLDPADRETLVRIQLKASRRAALKQQPLEGTNVQPARRLEAPSPAVPARSRDSDRGGESAEVVPVDDERPAEGSGVRPREDKPRRSGAAARRARAPAAAEVDADCDVGFSELP